MALIFQWQGDSLSPGNLTNSTAGTGDTAPSQITLNGGATATVVNSGSRAPSIQLYEPAIGASGWIDWNFAASASVAVRLYYTPTTTLASNHTIFSLRDINETRIADVNITGTGLVRVYDIDNASQDISAAGAIVTGTTYRFEVILDAETGVFNIAVYANHSTTPIASQNAVAGNFVGTSVGCLRVGKVTTTQQAETQLWDDIAVASDNVYIGPSVAVTTITAGADLVRIEPFSTVHLSAQVLSGAASSWAWTQLSGIPVTLTGSGVSRTFIAPASTEANSLTFQVTANGSIVDTVDVAVVPHLEWMKTASGTVPIYAGK